MLDNSSLPAFWAQISHHNNKELQSLLYSYHNYLSFRDHKRTYPSNFGPPIICGHNNPSFLHATRSRPDETSTAQLGTDFS